MKNKLFSIIFFLAILLTVVVAVQAVTINSVTLNDTDMFYSNYTGNNIVHLLVNITGASLCPGNNVTVIADFSNLSVNCAGAGTGVINLTNSSSDIWNASCDVNAEAAVSNFAGGIVFINASENCGGAPSVNYTTIVLYNMTTPPQMPPGCQRFGSLTTNLSQVSNFNAVNFIIQIELNGSCLTGPGGGTSPWAGFQQVMMMNFSSLDMSSQTIGQRLAGLKNALQVNITPPHEFGLTRIYVDETAFAELNTNTTITLNNIPFASRPAIAPDNASRTTAGVTWVNNAPWSINITSPVPLNISVSNGNLTFTVTGFSGYNVTDNVAPVISFVTPSANYSNIALVWINATLNGTGTQISSAIFLINNALVAAYNNTNNTAYCNATSPGSELFRCVFNVTESVDAQYNLSITAYDFGGVSGNSLTSSILFGVDTVAPSLNITAPTNNSVINNFTIRFYANDSNINFTTINVTNATSGAIVSAITINTSGAFNITPTIPEGVYNITALVYDLAGRSNTSNRYTITYDLPPTGTLTTLTQNGVIYVAGTTTSYSVNGTAADTYSGVKNVTILLNGVYNGNATITGGNWNYTVNSLTAGEYNITARIFDNTINSLNITGTLIVDNVAPSLSVSAPNNSTVYNSTAGSMLKLNFTPSDNSGNISACWYNITGPINANVTITGCANGTLSSTQLYLANGTYNLTVFANDIFGNTASANVLFSVNDTAAPSVLSIGSLTSLPVGTTSANITVTTDESATCRWTAAASSTDYSSMSTMTDSNTTHNATKGSLSDGYSKTLYVTCRDLSGNEVNSSATFTVLSTASSDDGDGSSSGGGSTTITDPTQTISYDSIDIGALKS